MVPAPRGVHMLRSLVSNGSVMYCTICNATCIFYTDDDALHADAVYRNLEAARGSMHIGRDTRPVLSPLAYVRYVRAGSHYALSA